MLHNTSKSFLTHFITLLAIVVITAFQLYWLKNDYTVKKNQIIEEAKNILYSTIIENDTKRIVNIKSNEKSIGEQLQNNELIRKMKQEEGKKNSNQPPKLYIYDGINPSTPEVQDLVDQILSFGNKESDSLIFRQLSKILDTVYPSPVFSFKVQSKKQTYAYFSTLPVDSFSKAVVTTKSNINPAVNYSLTIYNINKLTLLRMRSTFLLSFLYVLICAGAFIMLNKNIEYNRQLLDFKRNFTHNMLHELNTPIATISAAVEALDNYNVLENKEKAREYMSLMKIETQRLSKMVDAILIHSQLNEHMIELKKESIELKSLLKECIERMRPNLEKLNGSIDISMVPSSLTFIGDATHFSNVFTNLIDNSLKYCTQTPIITIAATENRNELTMLFEDNGIGIEEKDYQQIFEPFHRIQTESSLAIKGYGLGLHYVHQIITLHRGSIEVHSNTNRSGSIFTIRVPKESRND